MKVNCHRSAGGLVVGVGRIWAFASPGVRFRWLPSPSRPDKYVLGLSWLWLHMQAGYDHLDPGSPMSAVWEPDRGRRGGR